MRQRGESKQNKCGQRRKRFGVRTTDTLHARAKATPLSGPLHHCPPPQQTTTSLPQNTEHVNSTSFTTVSTTQHSIHSAKQRSKPLLTLGRDILRPFLADVLADGAPPTRMSGMPSIRCWIGGELGGRGGARGGGPPPIDAAAAAAAAAGVGVGGRAGARSPSVVARRIIRSPQDILPSFAAKYTGKDIGGGEVGGRGTHDSA